MKIFLIYPLVIITFFLFYSCNGNNNANQNKVRKDQKEYEVQKSDEEWRRVLSPEQFAVLRNHHTERAFSGEYDAHYRNGHYQCAGCGNTLFSSVTKFDSGTGWPSFYAPFSENSIGTQAEKSYGTIVTEVHCKQCGGHLGHVFNDGIEPTGLRYCINSVALEFISADE